MAAKAIHFKSKFRSVLRLNGLVYEINCEFVARGLPNALEDLLDLLLLKLHRKHAVLKAIVVKDVGEGRSNDAAETIILKRPRRMLARRTASKVGARHQNPGATIAWLIHFKIRIELASIHKPPVVEEILSESRPLDPLQELLGDN